MVWRVLLLKETVFDHHVVFRFMILLIETCFGHQCWGR